MKNQKGFDKLFEQNKSGIDMFLANNAPSYLLEDFKQDFVLFFSEMENYHGYQMINDDEMFRGWKKLPEGMKKPEVFFDLMLKTRTNVKLEQIVRKLMYEMNFSSLQAYLNGPSLEKTTGTPFDRSVVDKSELSFLTQK